MSEAHFNLVRLACLGIDDSTGRCGAPSVLSHLTFSVDVEFEVAASLNVYHIFARFLWCEHRLVFGREVFDFHARGEVVHTGSRDCQRRGVILGGDGLTLHLDIVPERSAQSFLAAYGAVGCHQTVHHFVVGQVTAGKRHQFLLFCLDAVEDGDGVVGRSVVVTPHQRFVVGIRTDDGNLLLVFLQWQHVALVLQQHDGLACHVECQLTVSLGVHGRVGNLRPFHERRVVHLAKVEAAFKQSDDVLVDLGLGEQTAFDGFGNALVGVVETAFHVGAG